MTPADVDFNGLWWLSFADEDGFRGVTIVPGTNVVTAAMVAKILGSNPGGQVLGRPFVPADDADMVPARWVGRLLTKDECEELEDEMLRLYPDGHR